MGIFCNFVAEDGDLDDIAINLCIDEGNNIYDMASKNFLKYTFWAVVVLIVLVVIGIVLFLKSKEDPFLYSINFLRIGERTWDWLAFMVAFVSLVISALTAYFQQQTEKNTTRVDDECQRQILLDLTRHFYCNLIVICALEAKLGGQYDKYYPSEEHLEKLKINIDPQIFRTQSKKFKSVHELQTLLRNFNFEIDIVKGHLKSKEVFDLAKIRDFSTLRFKMGILTRRVAELMEKIWEQDFKDEIAMTIEAVAKTRNGASKDKDKYKEAERQWDADHPYYDNRNSFYGELFKSDGAWDEFVKAINTHIYIEMTWPNDEGGEKLFFIPFDKNDGRLEGGREAVD